MIIPQRHESSSLLISADGSTIAEQWEEGGRLYSGDGKILADLPPGMHLSVSDDGQKLLIRSGKSTYVMLDRLGNTVWKTDLAQDARSVSMSSDGSYVLMAWREGGSGDLRATLFGGQAERIWESVIP